MKKTIFFIAAYLYMSLSFHAQSFSDLSKEVPFDKVFRRGVLPNGLTYYIVHNENPSQRASFYIYHNVGAALENDNQNGLAHFLEHMAFNGTHTFPGKSIINIMELNGVKFGKDINAYTTTNETVYSLSRVPTNRSTLVDTCLLMLRDWCHDIALTTEEINSERGVISEEWRTRKTAATRVREKLAPTMYNGSIYGRRDVIGSLSVIKGFDPEEIRSFYHKWYRTDLQAIAIVGDVDVDKIEKQIISLFSEVPAVKNPKPRITITIPDNSKPLYALATDREYKNVSVSLTIRHAEQPDNSLQGLRKKYIIGFFNSLLKSRLEEKAQSEQIPFNSARIEISPFERGYEAFNVQVSAKEAKTNEAFEAIYTELQRVLKYGFTTGELERLKTNYLVSVENNYRKRDQIDNESYCKAIKTAYLEKISLPDAEFKYQFAREILPTITVEEVSAIASAYLTDQNRVFTVTGPDDNKTIYPTLCDILGWIDKVKNNNIEPYIDNTPVNSELLSKKPVPGKIVGEKKIDLFNATEWTLSNGAKVVFRPVDFKKQSVSLEAVSSGGSTLYDVNDLPTIDAISSIVPTMGIGTFDPITFKKVTTGKTAGCSFKISPFGESVSASAQSNDVETMLQLVYMRFEEPRFDKEKYDQAMERNYANVARKSASSTDKFKDTLNALVNNGNPRALKFDKAYLDRISFERMKEIYRERFSNAADFIFYITGDIDAETIKPLIEKYIGSINASTEKETWRDNGDYFPKGKHTHRISEIMTQPKATIYIKMRADVKDTRIAMISRNILASILTLRYTENIREKEGGTYGVSVKPAFTRLPALKYSLEIAFDCNPDKVDRLRELVFADINSIQKKVTDAEFTKVLLNMKKNNDQLEKNNDYWLGVLQTYYERGVDISASSYYMDILNQITPKDISKAAREFFRHADVLDVTFVPKER